MTSKRTGKIGVLFLALVWLAVVAGAVAIVLTRQETYGWWVCLVPTMAVVMLIIFTISFLPRKLQDRPVNQLVGQMATGALILAAIGVLGGAIASFVKAGGSIGPILILGLFFVIFCRIFVDFVKHCRTPKKRQPAAEAQSKRRT